MPCLRRHGNVRFPPPIAVLTHSRDDRDPKADRQLLGGEADGLKSTTCGHSDALIIITDDHLVHRYRRAADLERGLLRLENHCGFPRGETSQWGMGTVRSCGRIVDDCYRAGERRCCCIRNLAVVERPLPTQLPTYRSTPNNACDPTIWTHVCPTLISTP